MGEDGFFISTLWEVAQNPTYFNKRSGKNLRKNNMGQVIAIFRELQKTQRETAIALRDAHKDWEHIQSEFLEEEKRIQDQDFFKDESRKSSAMRDSDIVTIPLEGTSNMDD